MKNLRLLIPCLALLVLGGTGCFLTSAQILAEFELPNPVVIDASDDNERIAVDLNTIGDYADHKDELKGLTDLALLGTFENVLGPDGTVTAYITPGATTYATATEIVANATKLWGPASIGAAGSSTATVSLGWDESAALFDAAGKQILIDEAKGDGIFTLYTVGTPSVIGAYTIQISDGFLVLVLDGGL